MAAKLPWGRDEKSNAARKLLFRQFDPNGNGLLSLAEADKGVFYDVGLVLTLLHLGVVGDLQLGDVICKAVIMRAFQAAKGVNQVICNWGFGYAC